MRLRRVALALLGPLMMLGAAATGSIFAHHDNSRHAGGSDHAKHQAYSDSNGPVNDDVAEDRCAAVAASFRSLNGPTEGRKSVVYQCRLTFGTLQLPDGSSISNSDDCGGFGDRLSGVFGAAWLALSTRRALLLDWTGIEDWLEPNVVDWRPDEVAMGTPPGDAAVMARTPIECVSKIAPQISLAAPFVPIVGLTNASAMMNAMNHDVFSNPLVWAAMGAHRNVYLHTNRGISSKWLAFVAQDHPEWPKRAYGGPSDMNFCIFHALFKARPAAVLRESAYPLLSLSGTISAVTFSDYSAADSSVSAKSDIIGGGTTLHSEPVPFGDIWALARDSFTVAVHWRQPDANARKGVTCPVPSSMLEAMEELLGRHFPSKDGGKEGSKAGGGDGRKKATVLVVSTNAKKEQKQVLEYFANRTIARGGSPVFDHIFMQALDGEVHVNPREFGTIAGGAAEFTSQRQAAERQTMRDWWLMNSADVLMGDFNSGFSASAGLVATKSQFLYTMGGYKWHDRPGRGCALGGGTATQLVNPNGASPRNQLCAKRFCG